MGDTVRGQPRVGRSCGPVVWPRALAFRHGVRPLGRLSLAPLVKSSKTALESSPETRSWL
jgi:hypothetical protein